MYLQVADMFGIHESLLSKWGRKRDRFLMLLKDKPFLRREVNTFSLPLPLSVSLPLPLGPSTSHSGSASVSVSMLNYNYRLLVIHPSSLRPKIHCTVCSCTDVRYVMHVRKYGLMSSLHTHEKLHTQVQGLTVDGYWLRHSFLDLLNAHHPGHHARLSNGWLYGFCLRFDITSQMKTEKKYTCTHTYNCICTPRSYCYFTFNTHNPCIRYKSVEERLILIEEFHETIYHIQNTFPEVLMHIVSYLTRSALNHSYTICTQQDPVWGAFPPQNIWNADHIPAPFCINLKRSLNMKVKR